MCLFDILKTISSVLFKKKIIGGRKIKKIVWKHNFIPLDWIGLGPIQWKASFFRPSPPPLPPDGLGYGHGHTRAPAPAHSLVSPNTKNRWFWWTAEPSQAAIGMMHMTLSAFTILQPSMGWTPSSWVLTGRTWPASTRWAKVGRSFYEVD